MPDQTVPTPQYEDEHVRFAVVADSSAIRLWFVGEGCGSMILLTTLGAQRLSTSIDNAITATITRG